jgi:hypothetical protein
VKTGRRPVDLLLAELDECHRRRDGGVRDKDVPAAPTVDGGDERLVLGADADVGAETSTHSRPRA